MKAGRSGADNYSMLLLVTLLTAAYFAAVFSVGRAVQRAARGAQRRRSGAGEPPAPFAGLPDDDRPPATAKGWPPAGVRFASYVDEGFVALDAFLREGFTA